MAVEEKREVLYRIADEIKELDGVASVMVDDFDESAGGWGVIIVYPKDIEEDQRPVSSEIRKVIKNNPYGAVMESFDGVKKIRDRWGDVEVERSYYTVDIDLSGAEISAVSLGESAVFDKAYDGAGIGGSRFSILSGIISTKRSSTSGGG